MTGDTDAPRFRLGIRARIGYYVAFRIRFARGQLAMHGSTVA